MVRYRKRRMADDTQTTIENALAAPRKVQADGVSVEQHPLPDQLEAAKFLDAKTATRKTGSLGIRLQKLSPPGAD